MSKIRPTQIQNPGDNTKVLRGDGSWGGLPVSGESYVHSQGVAAATWTITHNLGYVPNVWVKDSANTVVEGDVAVVDNNTITITFASAMGGTAYLS